ncbi:hypothetical protein ACJMK2_018115 [Sinanodonta woodiana]|uniref:Uncharacterized protein n=1 Tax=Sinanodonta woodiana TaxID=1069815 RepID=A0ABD3UG25_SINWO
MSNQFPEHYFSISERLSHILDSVGYSQEDRNRKVMVANEIEVFFNIANELQGKITKYIFGSRGEGSTGPGLQSDIDYLYQENKIKAVTDLSQCQPEQKNYLMVKDNHTHPGYVKLQQIIISPDYTPVPVYLEVGNNNIHATDSLHRTLLMNTITHHLGNASGPALHDANDIKELSTDVVCALRCSQWPEEGYEWFLRHRLHGWPTLIQIENAREYGCFVTPVGHLHSSECHLEWRLSFSIAERDLTRSFEDTTMKVYILLKMIKKTYIEPFVGDAFSSYYCKVCMFWMRERIPRELWCNGNLLYCLVLCIRQLCEWATTGFCPDYFIRTNNIYDRKIIGTIRNTLVKILGNLLSSDCTFLLEMQCCNLGHYMSDQMSRFDYCIMPIMREKSVNYMMTLIAASQCRCRILRYIPQHYSALVDYLDSITYASKYLPYIMEYPLKHTMMFVWSQLGFCIAIMCKENAHHMSQEQVDYLVTLASGCLSFGINIDATSVRLKLCGLGMELGNHNLIETSLQHIRDYHMKYIYAIKNSDEYIHIYKELLKTQTSFSVIYLPTEMSITPKPLRMEMFRSIGAPSELKKPSDFWYHWGVVGSVICVYFFQYLKFSRQGKERHKEVAMYNMIHTIRTEPKIPYRDTAFNLLGYSFIQENQLTNAFRCFIQSLNIRPYHNAAKFYLGIILNRIHVTDIRHII